MEDAAHDLAVLQHVVVVVTPTRGIAAPEDQLSHDSANRARKYTTLRKMIAAMKM
jgi:hypothetical protein